MTKGMIILHYEQGIRKLEQENAKLKAENERLSLALKKIKIYQVSPLERTSEILKTIKKIAREALAKKGEV